VALQLKFTQVKTTKNTVIYADDGDTPAIPALYVSKAAVERLGSPRELEMVLAPPEEFQEAYDE
jgi:hypothetical protein